MLNKLAKLINVKSIVTLVLTGVFSYLAITGQITLTSKRKPQPFQTAFRSRRS